MPIDTSIYANQVQVNPLAAITNAAGAVNAVQANKLTQQTLQARNSLSNILSQSTNPDGSVNYANAVALASKDPNAALIVPELQSQRLSANAPVSYFDNKTNQYMVAPSQNMGNVLNPGGNRVNQPAPPPIPVTQLNQLHSKYNAIIDNGQKLIGKPDLNSSDITNEVADLVSSEHITPQEAMNILSTMPKGPGGQEADPDVYNNWIEQQVSNIKMHQNALTQAYGPSVDEKQLSAPAQEQAPQQEQQPQPQPQATNGQYNGNPNVAGAPAVNAPEYQSKAIDLLNAVRSAATGAPVANAAIDNVLNLAEKTDQIGTHGADFIREMAKIPGFEHAAGDSAANLQTIASHMAQIALANGMPESDARLAELQNANLTPQMLQQTIKNMAPFLHAVNEGNVERQKFYNEKIGNLSGNTPPSAADIYNAKQEWEQNYDPRVIEYSSLSGADKKKYVENLSPSDVHHLANSMKWWQSWHKENE